MAGSIAKANGEECQCEASSWCLSLFLRPMPGSMKSPAEDCTDCLVSSRLVYEMSEERRRGNGGAGDREVSLMVRDLSRIADCGGRAEVMSATSTSRFEG